MPRRLPFVERFWNKVDKSGGPNACWPWTGAKTSFGYGDFRVSRGLRLSTHRLAWELTHGVILPGLCVCHKCDRPSCCNPRHMFLGTRRDNTRDSIKKGRAFIGTPRANLHRRRSWQLTDADVQLVRESSLTIAQMAKSLNVATSTIWRVRNYRAHAHVVPPQLTTAGAVSPISPQLHSDGELHRAGQPVLEEVHS